jgi:hypothetical protein
VRDKREEGEFFLDMIESDTKKRRILIVDVEDITPL